MIEYFYSKIKPELLLHVVVRARYSPTGRTDLINQYESLQASIINQPKGTTFKPHRHIWKEGPRIIIAQESWIVLKGKVKCTFYDIDNSILAEHVLNVGDLSITLEGGHTYTLLEDSLIVEYKTGPYQGQQKDKEFI